MSLRTCRSLAALVALVTLCSTAWAQDLGHKLPGLLGLEAGKIPEPGLYLVDRAAVYEADELRDRNGNLIATGPFHLQAVVNAIGISYTTKIGNSTFLTMTAGGPIARLQLNVQDSPEIGVDRFGLGDPYIQPVRLGWRKPLFDLVTSYSIYLPRERSALAGGQGVSSGQITQEFSGGGSIYFKDRSHFLTALASYLLNSRQRGIDIRRGDMIQIQGGLGTQFFKQLAEGGIAGYFLRQVRDDRGSQLPSVLAGSRDQVNGLGPEGAVLIKSIRAQIRMRYEWDFGVRTRPQGQIFVSSITFRLR